jgi:hypothetical protein
MRQQILAIFKFQSARSTDRRYCRKDFRLGFTVESFLVDTNVQSPLPNELREIGVYDGREVHAEFLGKVLRISLHSRIYSHAGCHGSHK